MTRTWVLPADLAAGILHLPQTSARTTDAASRWSRIQFTATLVAAANDPARPRHTLVSPSRSMYHVGDSSDFHVSAPNGSVAP